MPLISVDDLAIHFCLRRSARVKRLQIMFKQTDFEVVAPYSMSNHTILAFVIEKRKWMARALKQSKNLPVVGPLTFCTENEVCFRGRWWPLTIQFGSHTQVELGAESVICTLPVATRAQIQKALKDWLRQQTLALVQISLDRICPLLGRWPSRVVLKQPKTRWGSCGINDVISLHWHLVFAPEGILEYVVAHELCHLVHRNHGKRFWQKVEKVYPEHVKARSWLRKEGQLLMQMETSCMDNNK